MKNNYYISLILILAFISCTQKKDNSSIYKSTFDDSIEINVDRNAFTINEKVETIDFCGTLGKYFEKYEIKPIVDKSYNDRDDTTTTFNIKNHVIVWNYNDSLTNVKIDGEKIDINKEGFNEPYSIGRIRLFSINKREILSVVFYVVGCGGNCFDGNTLFYDLKMKTSNYFSYTVMDCCSLYDFKEDDTIDLLVPKFEGNYNGPFYEKYSLYRLSSSGIFTAQKDKTGKEYFVKIFYTERTPEMKCEKFEINWFEHID